MGCPWGETVTAERCVEKIKAYRFLIIWQSQVEELDPRKDEERRAILREVEVRVMQYQDTMQGHYIIIL